MSLQISTSNDIIIDGQYTGLKVLQRQNGTVVYTPESQFSGTKYQEHQMPHARYSTAHPKPLSGAPGSERFEADVRALLATL